MSTTKKISILLCSPLINNGIGGISRWTQHILSYYNSIETSFQLSHFHKNGKAVYGNSGILKRLFYGIIFYTKFLIDLNIEIKDGKYHIVHLTSSASISLFKDYLAILLVRRYKVKTIIHFRFGRIPELYKKKNWEQKLLHKIIMMADTTIVIDKRSLDTLLKAGYRHIKLLPNPLSNKVLDLIENNKSIIRDYQKIVFAGHCLETKGVFELIESCKDIPNIKLNILGFISDDMKKILIEKAGNNYYKWLKISGETDFETIIKEMLSAGIFVLPSYTEGFPNVIIESMAAGCSIVSTKVGAIPELLDIETGDNYGLCIEPKNVVQLKAALVKMLNDREFAIKCGENARKRVFEQYSMPKIWGELEDIWDSTISRYDLKS